MTHLSAPYLAIAKSQPPTTPKEEINLARIIATGDKKQRDAAAQRLVLSHIPMVIKIASAFSGSNLPASDLVQEGIVGLYRATTGKFDPSIARFSTYGFRWAEEAIRTHVRDNQGVVRIPVSAQRKRQEVKRKAEELTTNGVVAFAEVATALKMKPGKVSMFLTLGQESSLNVTVGDGETERLQLLEDPNSIEPCTTVHETQFHGQLYAALDSLDPRERRIVTARVGMGEDDDEEATLEKLSVEFSISRERVRQIQMKALEKLALTPQAELLREFLD
ncbi:MAG: sigma-70 family RNA polymerase sigma factor [Candidatus Obscuribacterales bacterium]|nr:sigma-70 family RNA polymerase sigma factor [Candidatus Obscuribacterales bacterium]